MKIGFIGLGIMGRAMCKNLIKSGCDLRVFDVNRKAMDYFSNDEVYKADSVSNTIEGCDIVFIMVRNSEDVHNVMLSEDGILQHTKLGMIVVDMSSITPSDSIKFAKMSREYNITYLDIPVSGGEPKAIDGTLAFMAGGDKNSFERVKGLLKMMGESVAYVGKSGNGTMTKLLNQTIVNLNIAVIGEAMVLGAKSGLDLNCVYKAISCGLAGSAVLDAKLSKMISGDFKPGGSLFINYKDINNVLSTADQLNVPMPLTSFLHEIMKSFEIDERKVLDHSALVKFFENQARVTLQKTIKE